jgi:DNA-binding MarR family transcriptional regulator
MSTSPWADPGEAGEQLALEDFPTFLFGRVASFMQRDVAASYLKEVELNAPQWRVLGALATYTAIPFSELVAMSMSDKALVSRSLQTLAQRGLAHVKADPQHGKKLVCKISAKGHALYKKVLPRARRAQAAVLFKLSRDERIALHAALLKLQDAFVEWPAVSKADEHAHRVAEIGETPPAVSAAKTTGPKRAG